MPLLLAGAYLNMGQSSCGDGNNTLKCQGIPITHSFSVNDGSTRTTTSGNDVILVLEGPLRLEAGGGNDTICILAPQPGITVYGGAGDDEIHAGAGGNRVYGGNGDDQVVGGDGDDVIYGGAGIDVLSGGGGNDVIRGENDNDLLSGDDGTDELWGGNGDDLMTGGDGQDALWGGPGADDVNRAAGDDLLFSQDDNDAVDGGAGNDIAYPCGASSIHSVETISYDNADCPVEQQEMISVRLEVRVGACGDNWPYVNFPHPAEAKIQPYFVSLGGGEEQFFGDRTGQPQFESGSTHVHDFLMPGTVHDIRDLTIRNAHGNDDSCVSRVRLGVNHLVDGNPAYYTWVFDSGSIDEWILSPPHADSTLTFTLNELRADSDWAESNVVSVLNILGTGIDYATLTRYVEQIMLKAIEADNDLRGRAWPHHTPAWVVIQPGNQPNEAHVWSIFSADLPGRKDWLTIDFDARVECRSDGMAINLVPFNFNIDIHGILHNIIQNRVGDNLNALTQTMTQGIPIDNALTCTDWAPEFDNCGMWLGVSGSRGCPYLLQVECKRWWSPMGSISCNTSPFSSSTRLTMQSLPTTWRQWSAKVGFAPPATHSPQLPPALASTTNTTSQNASSNGAAPRLARIAVEH